MAHIFLDATGHKHAAWNFLFLKIQRRKKKKKISLSANSFENIKHEGHKEETSVGIFWEIYFKFHKNASLSFFPSLSHIYV